MRKRRAVADARAAEKARSSVRQDMALLAAAFAENAAPVVTELRRSERYDAPDGPYRSTLVEFGNGSALAGYDADEHTHDVHCWLDAPRQNERLTGGIRWEGSDQSCAGAIAELDGLIDASLHLRAALTMRAEAERRLVDGAW